MGFVAVCTALYDYQPQSDGELELKEGELLYILEKSTDDNWWRAKKRPSEDEEEEPEGLIPDNYVEDAAPTHSARALYDYTRQTDEEVSFPEDAHLEVYDTSDSEWTLVGIDGDFGFAPANYIELVSPSAKPTAAAVPIAAASAPSSRYENGYEPQQEPSPPASPPRETQSAAAANLARVLGGAAPTSPVASRALASPALPQRQVTPPSEEEEAPSLPRRPPSQVISQASTFADNEPAGVMASPPLRSTGPQSVGDETPLRPSGGFHLYNINEMVSAMGRRKKMPVTLGLNVSTGTIMLSPEKSRDGPTQEWTADKLEHYSLEGKHVFIELNRPSKSLDLHAGAKDTANEIIRGLGDIAGAHRALGLKEVINAASSAGGQKKGVVLYDFMAQGEDEVTVAEGDEVVILDDTKSEEWWNVRRIKNGSEGVVPSSYVEVTGTVQVEPPSRTGINAGRSTVEQNRIEEERLAKEAARINHTQEDRGQRELQLPERDSSLQAEERRSSKKDKRSSKADKTRSKPDPSKVRTWTDHSGSFKVDAQLIGVADGKIHLHKVNGVKIAVPVTKMSPPDLAYIEKVTNEPIDDLIPVADLIKMKRENQASASRNGASVEPSQQQQTAKGPEYDWFDFFLSAGVGPHQCERYAQAMVRDSMDESVLPDITMETLRTLGLREGDALKVMKHIDHRLGRNRTAEPGAEPATGGLFTGPGGAIKDNTVRKRPEPSRTASDTVDASVFANKPAADLRATSQLQATSTPMRNGFDEDAWTPKPSTQTPAPAQPPVSQTATAPVSANMQALSLLDAPLQPTPAQPRVVSPAATAFDIPAPARVQVQPTPQPGANSQLFQRVDQVSANQPIQAQQSGLGPLPQINVPRQRPQAPQPSFVGSALLQPPPRPSSAPQNPQQFGLQPLQPQLTGVPSNARPAQPGQSLDELTSQRMQQYAQFQAQQTGLAQQNFMMPNGLQPQMTGYPQQQYAQMPQPYLNGNAAGSPFADPRGMVAQQTGYGNFQLPGGVNSILPPALVPQQTAFRSTAASMQPNGFNGFNGLQQGLQPQSTAFRQPLQPQSTGFPQSLQPQPTGFGQSNGFGTFSPPPVPPIPQMPTPAPLMPQRTGPAPNVSFGTPAPKLQPQPTGRANLAKATAQNPFGF